MGIKEKAIELANKHGIWSVSREQLCYEMGIPTGSLYSTIGMSFEDFMLSIFKDTTPPVNPKKPKTRATKEFMREYILRHATNIATDTVHDYTSVKRPELEKLSEVSGALIQYHFGTMANLQRDILRRAIDRADIDPKCLQVVGQAIIRKDRRVHDISDTLRQKAINSII